MSRPQPITYGDYMTLYPEGSWWDLTLFQKSVRWLSVVPLARIKALLFMYRAYRDNRDDVTLKEAHQLLYSVYSSRKLNAWWRAEFKKDNNRR